MTTLVAVRKNDEVVIAADSLTTFGDTRLSAEFDRTSEKIVHYKGTHIGLCGSAAHQLVFESLLAAHGDLDFSTKGRHLRNVPQAASDPEGAALSSIPRRRKTTRTNRRR
jgi:ATP-dependent protease HslVU (ClpYQ) peptidase subunit